MFVDDDGDTSRTWIAAAEAVLMLKEHFGTNVDTQSRLIHRAAASMIATRCVRMKFGTHDAYRHVPERDNCFVSHEFWEAFEEYGLRATEDWVAGDFGVYKDRAVTSIFGVEFCAEDVQKIVPRFRSSNDASVTNEVASVGQIDRSSPLSEADAQRFAKAIIAGWPEASQDWAHEKALLFFPDRTISRDNFRAIFRAIQGPKNRGKPRKS